jgi:hypothetical protein
VDKVLYFETVFTISTNDDDDDDDDNNNNNNKAKEGYDSEDKCICN